MNGFFSIVSKEFMHIRRDPTTLRLILVMPLLQLVLLGYAINFDVRHIEAVVVDMDNSRESRQYVRQIEATEYIRATAYARTPDEAVRMLVDGRARVGVVIPEGFARTELAGGNPQVRVMVDGSDSQVSVRARFAFVSPPAVPPAGQPDARVTVLFNPTSRSVDFMIPGLMVIILGMVTAALTAFSIVREREQGTLEQLMVTPVGRLALMIGKIVPYAVLAFVEFLMVLGFSNMAFGVQCHGSVIVLAIMSVPFVLASLAQGLFISTVAQTQAQALQYTQLTLMPAIMLSGYISPRETLPGWLYLVSTIMPATHFMQITRGVMIRGAGFFDLVTPFFILIFIAALLVLASAARFRKSLS